jgi:outer membrane autotransporter protein
VRDKKELSLLFTSNADLANAINYTGEGTIAYSPIYKYVTTYSAKNGGGYFDFALAGGGGSDDFNPAVLTESASAVAATAVLNNALSLGFQHADNYMTIPYLDRLAYKMRNRYALNPADVSDVGANPLFLRQEEQSVWVKPYTTFENVPLRHGPKVSNISYGTMVGFDTGITELRHGWDRVFTGFVGYNGASQRYLGVDTYQNGGVLGGTMTLYKGNFFNATTIAVGASVGENKTMYGTDHNTTLLSGIGNKTGYNFEFKNGKFIIQPSLTLSYNFIKTFDYTNAAGVRMDSDPINSIQLQPTLRFIGNLKNGWQPYASVSMVWDVMGKSHVTADGVRLPDMSIKPYVQYGVGVQKTVKDYFIAFGQAMIQNGGRNGISLSGGMRWAIGHDRTEKVQKEDAKQAKTIKAKDADKNIKNVSETRVQEKQELSIRLENNNNILKTILKAPQTESKPQTDISVKRSF